MTSSNRNSFRVTGNLCGEFPVNSPHKSQWHGALMFTLICARMNGWVNNRDAGDLRRYLPPPMTSSQWTISTRRRPSREPNNELQYFIWNIAWHCLNPANSRPEGSFDRRDSTESYPSHPFSWPTTLTSRNRLVQSCMKCICKAIPYWNPFRPLRQIGAICFKIAYS